MVVRAMVLDRWSLKDVHEWRRLERDGRAVQWDFYAHLQQQRSESAEPIQKAIVRAATGPFLFKGWQRIVDYNYSIHPLSTRGSVVTDPGGRFNIGDIDRAKFPTFPALYLASDHPTALAEKFGLGNAADHLSAQDFALRSPASYSCLSVSGEVETVLDLGQPDRLQPLVDIISRYSVPAGLATRARKLGLEEPSLVRTARDLVAVVTAPNWRVFPMQFDVPSTSQILAQLAMSAGVEAILYPSNKTGSRCLAMFPDKLGERSYVELDPPLPTEVHHRRLDARTFRDFL